MNDYISRKAVLSKCADIWDNADETTQTGVDTINTIDEITDFIESLPTADVQPVKRGRWISSGRDNDYNSYCRCSRCNNEIVMYRDSEKNPPNYCDNCGARMDGDTNG